MSQGAQPFAPAFEAGAPEVQRFLPSHFRCAADRARAVEMAGSRAIAPAVLAELTRQQEALHPSAQRDRHLEQLRQPGTTVVVTGQQVGLYLGPLYTFYKAATAVVVARALARETGRPVVPLFWLQTEDHDFAEVASCALPEEHLRLAVAPPERSALAHYRLAPEIEQLNERLAQLLAMAPAGAEVAALFARHYQPGRPLGQAFAGILGELFAEEGLLLFNPRTQAVAQAAIPVQRRALERCPAIEAALSQRCQALRGAGFRVQVGVRQGCALSFFHPQGPQGPRYRLQREGAGWLLAGAGGSFTERELQERLQAEPLAFSTSALLRPILQDSLFPTAAVVAGPGEIAYFAQLEPLYRDFELPVPMIVPRHRYRMVEPSVRRALKATGLRPEDAALDDRALALRAAAAIDAQAIEQEILAPSLEALVRVESKLLSIDPSLQRNLVRTRRSIEHNVARLINKVVRAQLRKDTQWNAAMQHVRARLQPQGKPQERVWGLPYLAAKFGVHELKRLLLREDDPFRAGVVTLEPQPLPAGVSA